MLATTSLSSTEIKAVIGPFLFQRLQRQLCSCFWSSLSRTLWVLSLFLWHLVVSLPHRDARLPFLLPLSSSGLRQFSYLELSHFFKKELDNNWFCGSFILYCDCSMLRCSWQLTRCQRTGAVVLYQCSVYGHWNLNFIESSSVSRCFFFFFFLDFKQGFKNCQKQFFASKLQKNLASGQVYPFGHSWPTPALRSTCFSLLWTISRPGNRLRQEGEPIGSTLETLSLPFTSQTGKGEPKLKYMNREMWDYLL